MHLSKGFLIIVSFVYLMNFIQTILSDCECQLPLNINQTMKVTSSVGLRVRSTPCKNATEVSNFNQNDTFTATVDCISECINELGIKTNIWLFVPERNGYSWSGGTDYPRQVPC